MSMNLGTLVAGSTLPEHRVIARMPQETTENKIHEDTVARDFGFRGALVPGVTLYAWMTRPVVAHWGADWLGRGMFSTRFSKPVYFEEPMSIQSAVSRHDTELTAIETRVVNRDGVVCATATMSLTASESSPALDLAAYPAAPLPTERPLVSREILEAHRILGTPELFVDVDVALAFLDRVSETLPIYAGPAAVAHPGLYLSEANRALSRNVVVSPWIHVESEGRHLSPLRVGERLETRARVKDLFEKKGHQFAELDLLLVAERSRPVAHIRHVAIYQLRGASSAGRSAA